MIHIECWSQSSKDDKNISNVQIIVTDSGLFAVNKKKKKKKIF
jgi:hypothetical protein